jgi:N-sulfoglucosamine sulfohydrolase
MRTFSTLSLLLAALSGATGAGAAERPNVVVFIADDVSWNDLGAYGNEAARTPHIDRLAAEGLTFTNAFLTTSSCSPSRASLMTGRYPHNTGEASELHRPWAAHLATFPELLRAAGYYTAQAGKYHMSQREREDGTTRLSSAFDREEPEARVPGNSGGHGRWLEVTRERPRDQPFFLWLAAIDAHRAWDGDDEWDAEAYGPKHDPARVIVPPFMVDTPATRTDLASYYNEVTRFDHFVGLVVAELEEQGVLDDTVVVVMADNGRPFPRAKTRLHDAGMKTPFVMRWPGGIRGNGESRDGLVSAIDLAPTFLNLAGVSAAETMQGVSFRATFDDPGARPRRYAFSEHNWHDYEAHGRALRDGDGYLYIRNARPGKAWLGPADSVGSPSHRDLLAAPKVTAAQADVLLEPRPAEELYHTPTDPEQVVDLVDDPAHADRLTALRRVMDEWQDVTGDSVPEDFSPDYFDRETGYVDKATGKRVSDLRQPEQRDVPGHDRGAERINKSGPR